MRFPQASTQSLNPHTFSIQENLMNSRYVRQIQGLAVLVVILAASATALHAQTYTALHTFPIGSGNDSGTGFPQVISQGRDGDLYSTVSNDGTNLNGTAGTVYKITTAGILTTVYNFCALTSCADGVYPQGGVTLGFDGNFYGTTAEGSPYGSGTAFKVTPTGTLTTLYTFTDGSDGGDPLYAPLQGQDGNTYGVATFGGTSYGTFYRITPSRVFKAWGFGYTDGYEPNLPTEGTDGNFYGTTVYGGTNNLGVVYKITPAGKITLLHTFAGSDGEYPLGILVQGPDGNFYGTTSGGGASGANGVVFKITPTGTYTLLHSFIFSSQYLDAQIPYAGLTLGTDGNFYGTTGYGGNENDGAIFKITPAGKETVLYSFCSVTCADGFDPRTPLVLHTDGKFYGNTYGNSLGGAVFYSFDVGFKPLVNLVTWSAQVGKTVEILGQGFKGTTAVSFDGVAAKFDNVSDTYLTATVPAGALTGAVTVKTFTTTMNSNRSFLVAPQFTSFSPGDGIVGSPVTLTGVSFTQTTGVTIGGKAATFKVVSDTEVTATVPPSAKTGEKITIATLGGTATSSKTFAVVPWIGKFSPTSGPVGTPVTITGTTFTGTTKVTFGGAAAKSFQVINDSKVGAIVPMSAKTGKIQVTTPGGTATSSTDFTVTQ